MKTYFQKNKLLRLPTAAASCILLLILLLTLPATLTAQVIIGDSLKAAHPSAALEVFSVSKGFLPPCLTTSQRDSIANPADGLIVYDTDLNKLLYYHNNTWKDFGLWSARDSTSGNIYYNGGRAAIGPGSDTLAMYATLNITGSSGIATYVIPDSAQPAVHTFNAQLDHAGQFNGNFIVNTTQTNNAEGGTVGVFSYLESDANGSVAIGAQNLYTGAGGDLETPGDLPLVMGALTDAYVLDSNAAVIAVGSFSLAESSHQGVNVGSSSIAISPATYANIGSMLSVGRDSTGDPLLAIKDSFPDGFTTATLLNNINSTANDFNLYAFGEAKSYFGGNVGIGTLAPKTRLHVAGNATIDDTLFVSNGYISVGGLPLKKTGGAINLGDTALVEKLKITESPCDGCVLTSDSFGLASWEAPVIYHKTVLLDSSLIVNCRYTPVVLVPAPGSGKAIVPISVIFRYTVGTLAYFAPAAARTWIGMRNGPVYPYGWFNKSGYTFTSGSYSCAFNPRDVGTLDMSGKEFVVENDDLIFQSHDTISSGNGTVKIEVIYMIIPY